MADYSNFTLEQYRDALASDAPTPGGGTAAAVALSQGAALAIMVCNLTLGKDKWKDGWGSSESCKSIAEPLLDRGYELAGQDAEAFDRVMSAFKMPKNTDEEVDARRTMIRDETLNAAIVPMETARLALGLLEVLPSLASTGNSNAVTDVGVAGLLASAACKGALFNVEINLNSLPENMSAPYRGEMEDLRIQCREKSREIMHCVHDRMQS
jgi:formiminotetrahydrofolate cyclodeaminase